MDTTEDVVEGAKQQTETKVEEKPKGILKNKGFVALFFGCSHILSHAYTCERIYVCVYMCMSMDTYGVCMLVCMCVYAYTRTCTRMRACTINTSNTSFIIVVILQTRHCVG